MKLTTQKIEEIAKLARLKLSEPEKEMYAEQLSVVLNYVEQLNEVNTDDVPETSQVTGLENITRPDEISECPAETKEKLLNLFPDKIGKQLRVKAVFE